MICSCIGFVRPARIFTAGLFAGVLWLGVTRSLAAPVVAWVQDNSDTNRWSVEVSGLANRSLTALQRANWSPAQWQRLLVVRTEQDTLIGDVGMPAMVGTYSVEKRMLRFLPAFPLEAGMKYRASFYPTALPASDESTGIATAVLKVPSHLREATTVVSQIYPSASIVPENLLKFYVHFSAPMARGQIYEHIHLRNEAGRDVELPFLEIDEELWDPSMTRLTLFIDPGRIKRGVTPLEEVGPALQQGKRYTLAIDREWKDAAGSPLRAAYEKSFQVGPADREPVDPGKWRIQAPRGAREPLVIRFPEAMEHALAMRMIRVIDTASRLMEGSVSLNSEEHVWQFLPAEPWRKGHYHLSVQKTIEDLAGNNIGKAFEVDLFGGVQRRFTNSTVLLPFEIR